MISVIVIYSLLLICWQTYYLFITIILNFHIITEHKYSVLLKEKIFPSFNEHRTILVFFLENSNKKHHTTLIFFHTTCFSLFLWYYNNTHYNLFFKMKSDKIVISKSHVFISESSFFFEYSMLLEYYKPSLLYHFDDSSNYSYYRVTSISVLFLFDWCNLHYWWKSKIIIFFRYTGKYFRSLSFFPDTIIFSLFIHLWYGHYIIEKQEILHYS